MWSILFFVLLFPCLFLFFVGMNLCNRDVSYLFSSSICFIVFFCLSLSVLFIVYVTSQLVKYLIAANLCSGG